MASLLFMKWREGRMPFFSRQKNIGTDHRRPSSAPSQDESGSEQPETPLEESEKDIKATSAGPPIMNKTQ